MTTTSTTPRKSVQGGDCMYPDTVECALERTDCDDPANFRSARELQGGPVNAHGGSCRWQSSVTTQLLGRCVDDIGLPTECAPNLGSCPAWDDSHARGGYEPPDSAFAPPREWVGPAVGCTVGETLFGRCDYGMCAWSHEHCHEDNTWMPFSDGCTCDKVQVGGCGRTRSSDGEKEVFCAVSSLACDDEQTWIAPQEVLTAAGFECYLCREQSPPPPVPTMEPTVASRMPQDPTEMSVILIVLVGSVIAISIVGLVGYKALSTRSAIREQRRQKEEENRPPPTQTIEIHTIGIAKGHENLDQVWGRDNTTDDAASVLSEDSSKGPV